MIQKLLQQLLPFETSDTRPQGQLRSNYQEWDQESRQIHIAVMSCLAALLYIIFTLLDLSAWVSAEDETMMCKLHLFLITPMILTVSLLAYQKRSYKLIMAALAIAPIIAAIVHSYITSKLSVVHPFLPEGYFIIIWIFILSGMTFQVALVSATISALILLVPAYFYMDASAIYPMHAFWIFCSFTFGFFSGLILDRSRKATFSNLQALQSLAVTDPLTGLYNRNELDHTLSKEIERSKRYGNPFSLLIIDIDHFKTINDTYGHDVGDDVLRKTAEVLSKCIRGNDTIIRWGGEEFIIISIEVNQDNLMALCEKFRTLIQNTNYACAEKITVSIGASLYQKDDAQQGLISRADKALYQAKAQGRNKTVLADS